MSDEHCVFAGGLRNGQIARLAVAKFGRRNFHETQALILNAAHKFDRAVLRTRIDDQDVEAEAGFLREHCRQNAAKDLPGFLVGMMTDALTAVGVAPDLKLVIYAGIGESLALQVLWDNCGTKSMGQRMFRSGSFQRMQRSCSGA